MRADQLIVLIAARLLAPDVNGHFSARQVQRLADQGDLVAELLAAEERLTPSAAAGRLGIEPAALARLEQEGLLSATQEGEVVSYRRGDVEALAPHWRRHQHRLSRWRSRVESARSRTRRALAATLYAKRPEARALGGCAFWCQVVDDHLVGTRAADGTSDGQALLARASAERAGALGQLVQVPNPRMSLAWSGGELQTMLFTLLGAHRFAVSGDELAMLMASSGLDGAWLEQLPSTPIVPPPAQFLPLPFIDRAALLAAYPLEAALESLQAARAELSDLHPTIRPGRDGDPGGDS